MFSLNILLFDLLLLYPKSSQVCDTLIPDMIRMVSVPLIVHSKGTVLNYVEM